MKPGPRNLVTDVDGILVGNASDSTEKTGVTVVTSGKPFTVVTHAMGGVPGRDESELWLPPTMLEQVDAIVISGGTVFGHDAEAGVCDALRELGRGFPIGNFRDPIVAVGPIYDLTNGGKKTLDPPPYEDLGWEAYNNIGETFELGTVGAGTGATTADLKGGLGSASFQVNDDVKVGAVVAVNSTGSVTVPDSNRFWAAPFEVDGEFGDAGLPDSAFSPKEILEQTGHIDRDNISSVAVVATNVELGHAEAKHVAVAAHDGFARAIVPSHTALDCDVVFVISTGEMPLGDEWRDLSSIGNAAWLCVARSIARAVVAARPEPGDVVPCWVEI